MASRVHARWGVGDARRDKEGVKSYTQRAKQGVLRNRVLLPAILKETRSDSQLNLAQPVVEMENRQEDRQMLQRQVTNHKTAHVKRKKLWVKSVRRGVRSATPASILLPTQSSAEHQNRNHMHNIKITTQWLTQF